MKLAIFAALAAGMAFPQTPVAPANPGQPAANRPFARRAMVRRRLMQALNLTDAQKAQARAIFQQARQAAQPAAGQMKQNRQALAAAVKANDAAEIHRLSGVQGELAGQAAEIRAGAMARLYQILTPEQRDRTDRIQQRLQERQRSQRRAG